MLPGRIETHGSSMAKNRWMSARIGTGNLLKLVMIVVIAASFGLAACVAAPPEVSGNDPELVEGRDIYARNCTSCHASDGAGGVGRKLSGGAVIEAYPNIKDQIDLIANGKGAMPSYAGKLTGQQMEAVARYTREVL